MGLGDQEMIFIFLALLFGAKKIPERAWETASKNSKTPQKAFGEISEVV